jgi:hypothetical protein
MQLLNAGVAVEQPPLWPLAIYPLAIPSASKRIFIPIISMKVKLWLIK